MPGDDIRAEFASLAASLRTYLEWHRDAGTDGFVRGSVREHREVTAEDSGAGVAHRQVATATAALPPEPAAATAPTRDPHDVAPASLSAHSAPSGAAATSDGAPSVRLVQLAKEVSSCTRCGLAAGRTQTVFARGNPAARVCFVGEAPGADEDEQGLPFVGRAGQLLDRMIVAMGLSPKDDVYVCNIVKCRPPDNRRPEPEEIATCIPYLHEQLSLVRPRVIVALGNTAVAALLDTKMGITKIRGQWKLYRGQTLVMPTYHPSYLLRPSAQQVEAKRQTWQDLQAVMKELGVGERL